MTEKTSTDFGNETKEIVSTTEKDWLLQLFVNMVNNATDVQISLPITLITHGLLVSGRLIGGKQYFESIGEVLSTAMGSSEGVKNSFIELGEKTYSNPQNEKKTPPTYIHLQEAKFFHPNGNPVPINTGVYWRGRISEVSGFMFGTLNAE